MHSRVYVWILWLILVANSLNVAAVLCPVDACDSQASTLDLIATPSRRDAPDWLCTEPAAVSPALSLRCAHQSRQTPVLARSVSLVPSVQEHPRLSRWVLAPAFSLWRFFYPRKLSPPPAEDDPSLS